jgi:hypothetical protein
MTHIRKEDMDITTVVRLYLQVNITYCYLSPWAKITIYQIKLVITLFLVIV